MEQIQVVQTAFNEERSEYEQKISSLNSDIKSLERQMKSSVSDTGEIERLKRERDGALNDRDSMVLEKNQVSTLHYESGSDNNNMLFFVFLFLQSNILSSINIVF